MFYVILAATENMKSERGCIGSMKKGASFPLRVFSVSLIVWKCHQVGNNPRRNSYSCSPTPPTHPPLPFHCCVSSPEYLAWLKSLFPKVNEHDFSGWMIKVQSLRPHPTYWIRTWILAESHGDSFERQSLRNIVVKRIWFSGFWSALKDKKWP